MTDNPHRIIRQVLELDFGHTDQFLELQHVAAQVLQDQGLVAMESVFNQMAGPNQLVRLERLELDLGKLRGHDWPTQFSRRLTERLRESLEQALQNRTSTSSTTSVPATVEDSLFEQFLFFCQQGRLPWWGSKPSAQWLETLQETMTLGQWRTLAVRLRHNSQALRRLVYTASDRFLQTLLQHLNDIPDAARVLQLLKPEKIPQSAQSLWRERFWLTVLGYFSAASTAEGQPLMLQLLVERQTILKTYGLLSPEAEASSMATNGVNTGEILPQLPSPWQSWLERATVEDSLFEQFLFFCQQGRWPGWGSKPSNQWLETLERTMTPVQWRTLAVCLQHHTQVLPRVVSTASDRFLQTFLQHLNGIPYAARVLVLLRPQNCPQTTQLLWRERFWTTVLGHFTAAASADGQPLMQHLLVERQTICDDLIPEAETSPLGIERLNIQEDLPPLPSPWQSWLEAATQPQRGESQSLTKTQFPRTEPMAGTEGRIPVTPDSSMPLNSSLPASTQPSYPAKAVEDIYVEGAGMVILHPFFQELFNSLDLLEGKHFREQLSQRRAIALLSYLSFGEIDIPEYELLLPKLLCAWPWEEPLPPYDLNEGERQAGDELLSAVLRHWSALRSSSPEWLRETFFWRDGKLTPVDMGWLLTIERRAQDVLLNKLPWGIGVIRLPWMADFLHVSWTN